MSLVIVGIELDGIRRFLDRVVRSVDKDYSEIMERYEAGELRGPDELSNALFFPQMSEEIAVRAVLGELNALVEWELQWLAIKPFAASQPDSDSALQGLAELAEHKPLGKWWNSTKPKLVSELGRASVVNLIEKYYNVQLSSLKGFPGIEEIRLTVNAYKHGRGFKYRRRAELRRCGDENLLERHKLDREKTFQYIASVLDFLVALQGAIKENNATAAM